MKKNSKNDTPEKKPRIRRPVGDEMFAYQNRVPVLEIYYRGNDTAEVHTIFDKVSEAEIDAAVAHIAARAVACLRQDHLVCVRDDVRELLIKTLAHLLCETPDKQYIVANVEHLAKMTKALYEARYKTKF